MLEEALQYPFAKADGPTENLYGLEVHDPYRWLEDSADPQQRIWVAAQNELVAQHLSKLAIRDELRARFEDLLQYDRYYNVVRRGPYVFYMHNRGIAKQLLVYVQRGLLGCPRVLIDPMATEPDGTTRVVSIAPSRTGNLIAYALSRAGSERLEYRIRNVATGKDLPDAIRGVKFSNLAWYGNGFYYSRYSSALEPSKRASVPERHHQVWFHAIGTSQSQDRLIYADPTRPLTLHFVNTTLDEHFIVLTARDTTIDGFGSTLWCLVGHPEPQPVVLAQSENDYSLVGRQGHNLLFLTNRGASNWRVIAIDARDSAKASCDVIPETEHRLEVVRMVGKCLVAIYSVDGAHIIRVFRGDGTLRGVLRLPGPGAAQVYEGRSNDTDVLLSFNNLTRPGGLYRCDLQTLRIRAFHCPVPRFNLKEYRCTRVFYSSKDGTAIPMFLAYRKPLRRNGRRPLLLYGYGGNGACMTPSYDPLLVALLERNVVFALPCLRGGGEYGEDWHRAGWRKCKQNVFDDCIAALQWLQRQGVTSSQRSAVMGSSNGGLLVGVLLTQRPDLFAVALPDAGVLDMLRFQHFTAGGQWTGEYGTSDDPEMVPILRAYSPVHNVRMGVRYPATLVTTSKNDERVVPAHSFKFVAMLQARGGGPGPYLIRIEKKSGHQPSSLTKLLGERTDIYAFLLNHLCQT